ncbi:MULTISPECIES: hypothetical protein [Acinetobacter]|uniref:hypothetical protein n=1 Tax=Acinetobacter TaxID=469 RepID=UPI000806A1D7|nr:hypothetical protein [Acinetobacter gyllenbergii]OBY75984.1 hypothetical protein NG55_04770 [Acinetobacter gyllenbergii]
MFRISFWDEILVVLKQISMLLVLVFLLGCKEKQVEDFKYEVSGHQLCAVKTNDINTASEFGLFDSSFHSQGNSFDEQMSVEIYHESLDNLSNKESRHIFCFDTSKLKDGALETQIRLEIKKGKYLRQYEFINYSCLSSFGSELNLSKDQVVQVCSSKGTVFTNNRG